MRRHFVEQSQVVTLSVEEEAILADETGLHSAELDGILEDSNRLGDIVVSLGDAQATVSNTPEIGTMDQELVAAVADMAVAGTDSDPEGLVSDIMPPAEGLSAEGIGSAIKEKLVKMWEAVKYAIEGMWAVMKEMLEKLINFFSSTQGKIDALKVALRDSKTTQSARLGDDAVYQGKPNLLLINNKPCDVAKELERVLHMSTAVLAQVKKEGSTVFTRAFDIANEFKSGGAKSAMDDLKFITEALANIEKSAGIKQNESSLSDGKSDGNYLGSLRFTGTLDKVHLNEFTPNRTFHEALQYSSQIKLDVSLADRGLHPKEGITKVPLTGDIGGIKSIVEVSEDWIHSISAFKDVFNKMSADANKSRKALDAALKEERKDQSDLEFGNDKDLRALIEFNQKLNTLFSSFSVKLIRCNSQIVDTALKYAMQSHKAIVA